MMEGNFPAPELSNRFPHSDRFAHIDSIIAVAIQDAYIEDIAKSAKKN